jgi:hypothetical protein
VAGYRALIRSQLLLVLFGELALESIATTMIESWIFSLERARATSRAM